MSQTTIPIVRSRRGLPCLWEEGGGFTNTGRATIIADSRGRRKRPIYIRGSGKLSCEQHALIPIEVGDIVVKASHHRRDFKITVFRIEAIFEKEAVVKTIMTFEMGEWAPEPPRGYIADAVEAARQKALHYHCKEPHYA